MVTPQYIRTLGGESWQGGLKRSTRCKVGGSKMNVFIITVSFPYLQLYMHTQHLLVPSLTACLQESLNFRFHARPWPSSSDFEVEASLAYLHTKMLSTHLLQKHDLDLKLWSSSDEHLSKTFTSNTATHWMVARRGLDILAYHHALWRHVSSMTEQVGLPLWKHMLYNVKLNGLTNSIP